MEYLDYSELAEIYRREDEEALRLDGEIDFANAYTKVCPRCEEEYPLCEELFYRSRGTYSHGFDTYCKECRNTISYEHSAEANRLRRERSERGGKHTQADLDARWDEQGGRCYYCDVSLSREDVVVHRDHMTPLGEGGANTIDNIVWACAHCNRRKGRKKTAEEFFAVLGKSPKRG